jgi:hypothetical protein
MSETEDYDKSATPTAHKTSHQDGGSDEVSVEALAGELTAEQKSAWSKVSGKPTTFAPEAHKTSHQLLGADALSVAGLSGLLADGQTPLAHKTSHQLLGTDALSVAGLSGVLADDQHIIDTEAVSAMGTKANSNPLNHDRYADSEALAAAVQSGAITDGVTKAPTHDAVYDVKVMTEAHKTRHQDTGADEISVQGLSGVLADDQHVLDSEVTTVIQGYFQKARAYRAAAGIIPNEEWTKIEIDTDSFDPSNITDLTNHRITPSVAGYYLVFGEVNVITDGIAFEDFVVAIRKTGGLVTIGGRVSPHGVAIAVSVADIIYLNGTTDYVELFAYQHSNAFKDLEVQSSANYLSVLGPF